MKRLCILVCFLFAMLLQVFSQVDVTGKFPNVALGISRRAADSLRVGSVNVGIWNDADTLKGAQLSILNATVFKSMIGVNIGGIFSETYGDAIGFQCSPSVNIVSEKMSGVQLSFTSNVARNLRGLQLSVWNNIALRPFRGVQMSLVSNISRGVTKGMQFGGINITSGYMRGLQAGAYNYADSLRGIQLGMINVNNLNLKGFQLGLINISRHSDERRIGLVNIDPSTRIDLLFFGGNYDKFNVGWSFKNNRTYNILGIGAWHTHLGSRFSGSIYYRIGQYYSISNKWSIGADLGFSHIETFVEKNSPKPERLYSLQACVNLAYQINKSLGAFASFGYGQSRYYNRHREYIDKPIFEMGMSVRFKRYEDDYLSLSQRTCQQTSLYQDADSVDISYSSLFAYNLPGFNKKHPWWALMEDVGINVFVQSIDRYAFNFEYAKISPSSFWDNVQHGFVWDNDYFSTNQFAHPYHGNLYFNTARNNGLGFFASYPYALGGSLMWEFWGETDPPAINDVLSTSIGGAAIGEVMYRTSSLILNDSQRGMNRFLREFAAGVVNPIRAFNRIIHGDAWRVRGRNFLYHDYKTTPVEASLSIGDHYVADGGSMARGSHNLFFNFKLEYGDPFSEEATKPYDYFTADIRFSFGGQPLVNGIHLLGRLYGKTIYDREELKVQWGVFQYFNYYASDSIQGSSMKNPFEISETAAFGPGFIFRFPSTGTLSRLEHRIFADAIILGGSKSDYYSFLDRDYNIGSGIGIKSDTRLDFDKFGTFLLKIDYYHLFTWKGYEDKDVSEPNFDAHFLNSQGDKSHSQMFVVNPHFDVNVKQGVSVLVDGSYYYRKTRYHYYPNVSSHTYEANIGIMYKF